MQLRMSARFASPLVIFLPQASRQEKRVRSWTKKRSTQKRTVFGGCTKTQGGGLGGNGHGPKESLKKVRRKRKVAGQGVVLARGDCQLDTTTGGIANWSRSRDRGSEGK